ncbi:DUF1835 domain-containing protein [Psychroserpens luteolus]|uniref:DUF1835 domain-containing protein n=1 Tax=Psychroserpens luteolus TaxID=2855840 RepID=UPI001E57D939|nr:DUF1835 domain-containing protein [Psychroserpens luteolus]MCD2258954.1 DUF1835 domain-containing protein [Psychroserpens luteolus]
MSLSTLHITNGTSLTNYLFQLGISTTENTITWQETLCVGPTVEDISSKEFFKIRKAFFKSFYNISLSRKEMNSELKKLDKISDFTEIVLWFEYDLFCHINMVAVISLLEQKGIYLPIYLVCSGRVEGEKGLKGLSELKPKQLETHYHDKVKLTVDDIALAKNIWRIYCGKDHNLLLPLILRSSSFEYMSICLKAHIKRFPDTRSGISTLEYNILKLVKENTITSRHHLVGYTLHYQGYYGYGDLQLERVIDLLSIFFIEEKGSLKLNREGHLALSHQHNYQKEMNNTIYFGGVTSLDYTFDKKQNKLIKTVVHAN